MGQHLNPLNEVRTPECGILSQHTKTCEGEGRWCSYVPLQTALLEAVEIIDVQERHH